ncbi:MAG: recombinase family protein [Christensenellaceae bacterium]|jgi:site-specific DNA recombinase
MARKSRKNIQQETTCNVAIYIRLALYVRLSVEDNNNRGNSIDTQKMVLEEYISGHPEFLVYDTYIDNGATGTNFDRAGFKKMLADIDAGHIDCVIVKDLSRLGRNSIDTGYYIEQYFPAHNVRFISVNDQFDSEDEDGAHNSILLPLKNMINEAYSMDIGRKIKSQIRQTMKEGGFVGGRAPYGYKKDANDCHKLLVDEKTAPVVRQIFEWAYAKAGLNEIVRNLNELSILPPSHYKQLTGEISHEKLIGSGKWQTRTVQRILDTQLYTGDMVQGRTITVEHRQLRAGADNLIIVRDTHEAIVSREMFETAREYRRQVAEKSKNRDVTPYSDNMYKGKIFCGHCGISLHRQRSRDKYHFRCTTRNRIGRDDCPVVAIREDELTTALINILQKKLDATLGKYSLLFKDEQRQRDRLNTLARKLGRCKAETDKQKRFSRSLYENLVQGILSNEEYFTLKQDYDAKVEALSQKSVELESEIDGLKSNLSRFRDLEQIAHDLDSSRELTAELIDRLIQRIEIDHERNISVEFSFINEFEQYSKRGACNA